MQENNLGSLNSRLLSPHAQNTASGAQSTCSSLGTGLPRTMFAWKRKSKEKEQSEAAKEANSKGQVRCG